MARIVLLESNRRTGAPLVQALSGEHTVSVVRRWWELLARIERESPDVCIVDLDYRARNIGVRDLKRVRATSDDLALIAFGTFRGREMELFQMGRLGVDEVIFAAGNDDPEQLRTSVSKALVHALSRHIGEELGDRVAEPGLRCLEWALEHAHKASRVADMAESLLMSRRSLSRRLRAAGLLTPSQFLMWGRLFRATRLLEQGGASLENIAYRLGYSSGAALRRALKREAGVSPTEIVRRGGVDWVLDAFLVRLGQRRRKIQRSRWSDGRAKVASGPPIGPYR